MNDTLNPRCLFGEEELAKPVTVAYGAKSLQFPVDVGNISKVSELVASCAPSGFGMNERTVIDSSYRNCKEMKPEDFTTSNNYHEILPRIVTQVANILESPMPIYASLNKICVYETHGFFKEHVDTPQKNTFASLVVCLPTGYEGGMLIVEDNAYDLSSSNSIKWCAFYSDCKHRIDEVTKGFRVTLTYDLLYLDVPEPTPYRDILYKTLENSLLELHAKHQADPALSSNQVSKVVIGIPLASKYPSLSSQASAGLDTTIPILKGRDLQVLTILHDLGYTTDIKAVYSVRLGPPGGGRRQAFAGVGDVYEEEEYASDEDYDENYYDENVFIISDIWNAYVNDSYEGRDGGPYSDLHSVGARCLKNLIWLSKPTCQHAGPSYIAYGNEASNNIVYMDGCILAYK
ncbi:hypothetical protein BGX27_009156 [Mortierella sp. AM989]|nr:hypothetical protein BGX27_009156 [Mortierella sp. AM989]